jgi:hypothetical protein
VVSLDRPGLSPRVGEAKAGALEKRSFCNDGHPTPLSRAPTGKSESPRQSIITTPFASDHLPLPTSYTLTPSRLPHSTPSFRQKTIPAQLSLPTSYCRTSSRRRRSYSFHRHKILSISADSYRPTCTARHHQKHPARWPISPPRHHPDQTNTLPILNNPRSLHNLSTTRLPPPWIKKLPSLRRCCPPSLAAF